MKEKIVLIGAGSAMFTRGLVADLIRRKEEVALALTDIDPEALKVAERLTAKMIQMRRAPIQLAADVDRRVALKGATSVICTIGVGGRRAWEQDVFIPRKHGIFQPVGDSVMPGGTARALRMIPAMTAIARDVLDLAPQALFFNYGNPMGPVCRAVRKATGARMIGLCHGVFHVGNYLAGVLGTRPELLKYTAQGVNHLTWFTEIRVAGQDAMPRLMEIAAQKVALQPASGSLGAKFLEDGSARKSAEIADENPFTWQMMNCFGAFPAVLDRHITEFFPQFFAGGSYFGKRLGVDAYSFENTIAYGDKIYADMREKAFSDKPLDEDFFAQISGEHEQVIEIIESIRKDTGRIYSANLPNEGQIPNLPRDVVVESPAVADGGGLRAILQKPMPAAIAGTLATRLLWQETTVDAALEGSREKFIQALVLDGAVSSVHAAAALADDLLKAHAQYLPQFGA